MAIDLKIVRKHIGANIQKYRNLALLTQYELSIQADMNADYLAQIECGIGMPSIKKLYMIAEALKIEPFELLK